jgi:membrane-bound lytic murein transglycosylase F
MKHLLSLVLAVALLLPGFADARSTYDRHFQKNAKRFFAMAVDWRWFKAQAMAESALDPFAVSHVGARGLMQLMPFTSAEMSRVLGVPDLPFDPGLNILMGVAYNRKLWDFWHAPRTKRERLMLVFASYNAGPGNLLKAQRLAKRKGGCSCTWKCLAPFLGTFTGGRARETKGYVIRVKKNFFDMIYRRKNE